jgi:hypothetical protein
MLPRAPFLNLYSDILSILTAKHSGDSQAYSNRFRGLAKDVIFRKFLHHTEIRVIKSVSEISTAHFTFNEFQDIENSPGKHASPTRSQLSPLKPGGQMHEYPCSSVASWHTPWFKQGFTAQVSQVVTP